jgi:hypothetical protein
MRLWADGIGHWVASIVLLPESRLPVVETETRSGREIWGCDWNGMTYETLRS